MSFAQFHDGFYLNEKVQSAGSVGAWMWAASIGYASHKLTDGFVPAIVLAQLCPDLDTKPRLKVAARLVEVGLWEVVPGGWQIHDYLKWNLSKAVILARREANLARVNKHRGNAPRHGEGNARVMHYNAHYGAGDSERTNGVSNAPSSVSSESSSGETTSLLSTAASPVDDFALEAPPAAAPPATKPKRAAKTPKATKPPAPFTAGDAVAALASAAGGRFIAADGTPWAPGWGANIARHIQRVPDLAAWTLVGEWIAAGGGYRGTRGMPWVAGASFLDAVAQSKAWDEGGRYALVDDRGFPVAPPVACSDDNDPWVIAAAKQGIKL